MVVVIFCTETSRHVNYSVLIIVHIEHQASSSNPMHRTNLHSNIEVVMLLTLCTNFQVFAHIALQSSPMKLYFWCLANIFLKSLTNIFCLFPSFFTWNILKHLRYLCCKKYTARHRTEFVTFPGTPIANHWFSLHTEKVCPLFSKNQIRLLCQTPNALSAVKLAFCVQSLCLLPQNNFSVVNISDNCWKNSYNLWTLSNHNSRSLEGLGFRV